VISDCCILLQFIENNVIVWRTGCIRCFSWVVNLCIRYGVYWTLNQKTKTTLTTFKNLRKLQKRFKNRNLKFFSINLDFLALLGHLSVCDVMCWCAGQQQPEPAPFRGPKEYCYYETFDARCSDNEVILMTSALYGRMRFGRCVKTNFGFMGCFTDVLDLLDRRCSGRRSCSVEVVEPTFDGVRPCNKELKCYLEVDYRCIRSTLTSFPDLSRKSFVFTSHHYIIWKKRKKYSAFAHITEEDHRCINVQNISLYTC